MSTVIRSVLYCVVACTAAVTSGCFSYGATVNGTLSPDVPAIPRVIGVYPLLSNDVHPVGPVGLRRLSASTGEEGQDLYILPPAETQLMLTAHSQIMTDMLSVRLSGAGFKLKQLPVQLHEEEAGAGGNGETFVLSMSQLEHLREHYDLAAVVLGNVFFTLDRSDQDVQVLVVYVRVIDIETLDVLAQVSGVYGKPGQPLNAVADSVARELAKMAGLAVPPRRP